jgi:hypothetical protein
MQQFARSLEQYWRACIDKGRNSSISKIRNMKYRNSSTFIILSCIISIDIHRICIKCVPQNFQHCGFSVGHTKIDKVKGQLRLASINVFPVSICVLLGSVSIIWRPILPNNSINLLSNFLLDPWIFNHVQNCEFEGICCCVYSAKEQISTSGNKLMI